MLRLREMNPQDIPAVAELAGRIWRDHYPPIIGIEQTEYMLALWYSHNALAELLKQPGRRFLLAEEGREVRGFLSAGPMEDGIFVYRFYIDTAHQRKGIGQALLTEIVAQFPQAKFLRLHVNRNNRKALAFYEKHGFTSRSEQDTEIGDGYVMEDYVMQKELV